MVPLRLDIPLSLCHQGITLTQETAQTGIDEARLSLRLALFACCLHRLADQGVWRIGRLRLIPAQRKGCTQQRIDRCRRAPRRQQSA